MKKREWEIFKKNLIHPKKILNFIGLWVSQKLKPAAVRYYPVSVNIEPTINCNLECEMCQITLWDRKAGDLTFHNLRVLLNKIPSLMKVKLQGMGEPFLNKELHDMVGEAAGKDIWVEVTSNGTLLGGQDFRRKILDGPLNSITLSLDGATAETYEGIRGKGNLAQLIDGIKNLAAERKKDATPQIAIWIVGMRKNIHELPQMVQICYDLGVDKVTLQHDLSFWGKDDWLNRMSDQDLNQCDDFAKPFIDEAAALAQKLGIKFTCYQRNRFSVQNGNLCNWPWRSFYLTVEGHVTPCSIASDPEVANFGNLIDQSLEEIWNGEKYRKFRRNMKNGIVPDFCKGCFTDCKGMYDFNQTSPAVKTKEKVLV